MNKIIFTVLLFLLFSSTIAQTTEKSNKKLNINLPFYITTAVTNDDEYPFLFNPQFGIEEGKSMFYIGPSITMKGILSGGTFTYQVYPNGFGKRFDFFFQGDLVYQRTKYSYFFSHRPVVTETKYSAFIGNGFHLNISEHFYWSTHFGCGWYFLSKSYDPKDNFWHDLNYSKPGLEISLGIGINFRKK